MHQTANCAGTRTCAPLVCYCSYYTGKKAIKYSVNIALVFFQVSEWSVFFFATSYVYDKAFLEGFEIGH